MTEDNDFYELLIVEKEEEDIELEEAVEEMVMVEPEAVEIEAAVEDDEDPRPKEDPNPSATQVKWMRLRKGRPLRHLKYLPKAACKR